MMIADEENVLYVYATPFSTFLGHAHGNAKSRFALLHEYSMPTSIHIQNSFCGFLTFIPTSFNGYKLIWCLYQGFLLWTGVILGVVQIL